MLKKYKRYNFFSCLFMFCLQTGDLYAQEKAKEVRTINVNSSVFCQVDFNAIKDISSTSKTISEFFDLEVINGSRSLSIETKKTGFPAVTITVLEENGTIWDLKIKYKEDLDPETESNYNFSDNTAEIKAVENIKLTKTDGTLDLKNQAKPIPYDTPEEINRLTSAFPGINFNIDPPEQTRNLAITENTLTFYEDLIIRKPDLNLAYKNEMVPIRIVCENIIFEDSNAYLKLLIQNDGNIDFLTGNMILTWLKPGGSPVSLFPGKIHPKQFPIIKPRSQIAVIYPFRAFEIADEDTLKFELHDRLLKVNMEFMLPGKVYNTARKR